MAEMKKEYLVIAQQACDVDTGHWRNVRQYLEGIGMRYYGTLEAAKAGLEKYIGKWNKEFTYDSNGKRVETTSSGSIGIDLVSDKKLDDRMRVVAWKIRVREVTPWETVEVS